MNKYFILIIALLTIFTASSQDKIITFNNDTIYCRIVSINDVAIRYEQPYGGEMLAGKMIPLSSVAEYYRLPGKSNSTVAVVEKPWLLSFSIGGGYMPWLLESVSDAEISDENRKIQNGVEITANAHYLFNSLVGLGVQYSFFTSGINGNFLTEINPTYPVYVNSYQRERHYVNYAGPSVLFQQPLGASRKLFLTESISGGVLFYRGESQATQNLPYSTGYLTLRQNSLIEGTTMGAKLRISAGYHILPDMTLGADVDFMYGMLKRVDYNYKDSQQNADEARNYELESPLNISRINYSIVLQYKL